MRRLVESILKHSIAFALLAIGIATPVVAHVFWLQPRAFDFAAPARVPITIYVGHGAARDRWALDASRVVAFRSIGPDGVVDRKPELTLGGPGADAFVALRQRGSYVIAFQSMPCKLAS